MLERQKEKMVREEEKRDNSQFTVCSINEEGRV